MKGRIYHLHRTAKSNEIIGQGLYLGDFSRKDNAMRVIAGSKMRKRNTTNKPNTVRNRQETYSLHTKPYNDEYVELTEDVEFTSPALAAAVMMGREVSNLAVWKTSDDKTFYDYREQSEMNESIKQTKKHEET